MSTRDDGGPAFPTENWDNMMRDRPVGFRGMTVRDYLAAAALTGLCSATSEDGEWQTRPEGAAAEAYKYADAMLAERSK